ncbi:MAG TPA: phage protein Gp27 family protein [Candidatus Nitrosotenuis sp.]|nr:phage protein Gp27 family protein [Candidatus Nitrosotenuis sp.]
MPAGKHREGYQRPRKGEKRQQEKPLSVDRLPEKVREAIQKARAAGATWEETQEAAAAAARKEGVEAPSRSAIERWYDLRIAQVQKEVLAQAERARQLAAAFASKGFAELPEAAISALSSEVFAVMEAGGAKEKQKALGDLVFLLSKMITAQVAQEKLKLEKEKVAISRERLEATRAKLDGLKKDVAGKKKLSGEELGKKLDEIYDLVKPNAA